MKLSVVMNRARRYLTVGALCAITYNVIMMGADFAGLHYVWGTVISSVILAPMGYLLHSHFTFHRRATWPGFFRFSTGFAAAYPLSLGLMVLFCSVLKLPVIIAAPLTTICLIVYNYISAHWAILRRWRTT